MNEIAKREANNLTSENVEMVSAVVREMMAPIFQSIGKMLEHNAQAMEQIAAAQQLTSDRIEALEKQVRLNTPMSAKQAQYINEAIKRRARELLDKRGYADDKKAVTKIGNAIRKSVLSRHGVSGIREIPRHLYDVCFSQIDMWNDMLTIKDVTKEARLRAEHAVGSAEPASCMDGLPSHESQYD